MTVVWYFILFFMLNTAECCLPDISNMKLPPPVVHTECLDSRYACQRGYFCGPYGCTKRKRTLGVKTVISTSIRPYKQISIDGRFERCCAANLLPDKCIQFCTFSRYNTTSVTSLISDDVGCPVTAMPVIHYCASQNFDHSDCCSRNLIPRDCLSFCQPMKTLIAFEPSKMHCLYYLNIFKDCFYNRFIEDKNY